MQPVIKDMVEVMRIEALKEQNTYAMQHIFAETEAMFNFYNRLRAQHEKELRALKAKELGNEMTCKLEQDKERRG